MLRVDDMFALSKPKVASLFLDDVQDFFSEKGIYCAENVQFTGMSGFSHNYDFLFQRNRTQPERLCQAVNNPNKSSMGNILFAWNDTKPARRVDSQLIVILNDQNGIAKGIEDAFGRSSGGANGIKQRIYLCSLLLELEETESKKSNLSFKMGWIFSHKRTQTSGERTNCPSSSSR